MKIEQSTVTKVRISDILDAPHRLDPITVILEDIEPRKGKIIVECYGKSWSAYWGGMGDRTIAEFFCSCDVGYIAGKFGNHNSTIVDYDAVSAAITEHAGHDEYVHDQLDLQSHYSDLVAIYGDDWYRNLPEKPCPDYQYLCRIITTVQEALRQLNQSKAA